MGGWPGNSREDQCSAQRMGGGQNRILGNGEDPAWKQETGPPILMPGVLPPQPQTSTASNLKHTHTRKQKTNVV